MTTPSPIYASLLGPAELERLNSRRELAAARGTQNEAAKLTTMKEPSPSLHQSQIYGPKQVRRSSRSRAAKPQPGWAPQEHSDLGLHFQLYL